MNILTMLGLSPYATTSDVILAVIKIVLGFILIFFMLKIMFKRPTDKEWRLSKLDRRIDVYLLKMSVMKKLKILIEKNRDIDSIDDILIKYVPANKEGFIELKDMCKKANKDKETIYLLLDKWRENEEQAIKQILNQLNKEINTIKSINENKKKSFYE